MSSVDAILAMKIGSYIIPHDADGAPLPTCLTVLGSGAELKLMPRVTSAPCQLFRQEMVGADAFRLVSAATGQCLDLGPSINGVVYQLVLRAASRDWQPAAFRFLRADGPSPLVATMPDGRQAALSWNDDPSKSWVTVNLLASQGDISRTGEPKVSLAPAIIGDLTQGWPSLGADSFPRDQIATRAWDGTPLPDGARVVFSGHWRAGAGGNDDGIGPDCAFLELAAPPPMAFTRSWLPPFPFDTPPYVVACRREPWSNSVFTLESIDGPDPAADPHVSSVITGDQYTRCLIRGANGLYLQLVDGGNVYAATAMRDDACVMYLDAATSHLFSAGALRDYRRRQAGYVQYFGLSSIHLTQPQFADPSLVPFGSPIFLGSVPGGGIAGNTGALTVQLVT